MIPKYKIEIWDWEPGGPSALHSITTEVIDLYYKTALTDEIGSFSFTLPQGLSATTYNNVDLHDIVKIWLSPTTPAGNPNFIGRISVITGKPNIKVFSGLDQGEVLLRMLKGNSHWIDYDAHDMVEDLANDLGMYDAADVDDPGIDVTIRTAGETYFDLLRQVSDYYSDAVTKVQKDFFVGIDNHLHWKARSTPRVGVESFTVTNILDYEATTDVNAVRNVIGVYGNNTKTNPSNGDSWTEATTNWTITAGGAIVMDNADYITGANGSVHGSHAGIAGSVTLSLDITKESLLYQRDPKFLHFWVKESLAAANGNLAVYLYAPDSANWFRYKDLVNIIPEDEWLEYKIPVGENINEWAINGSPSWSNIESVHFLMLTPAGGQVNIRVDGLYFGGENFFGTATNPASIASYGTRNLLVQDIKLLSDTECSKRANALLMQYMNPPTQLTLTTHGNNNILIGDRVPVTITSEGLAASNFDILTVENTFNAPTKTWTTKATMTDSSVNRMSIPRSERDLISNLIKSLNTVGKGVEVI